MKINETILAAQPFFQGLSKAQLELLADDSMLARFRTDELIFTEGSPANRFYIILSGEVALDSPCPKCDDERGTTMIETIGAGSLLGWSWLIPPYYSQFTARALTPVEAIFFYGTRVREQSENDHDLGYELMKRIAESFAERLAVMREQLAKKSKNLSLAA